MTATRCMLFAAAVLGLAAAAPQAASADAGCNHSATAPIALGSGPAAHTLLLFWAGADCNAAVAGRAILDADGHAIYLFIEDPNRIRLKEPGVPLLPSGYVPPLANMLADELAKSTRTGAIGPYPAVGATIYPTIDPTDWERARAADLPMMCHNTGYTVSACFWLDPGSGEIVMLYESGA